MFCGYMILLFSWIHAIAHLATTFETIQKTPLAEINAVLAKKRFSRSYTFAELLFTTKPGVTGLLLLLVINLITIASG